MTSMFFKHFCGNDICSTVEEVKTVLDKDINGVNEFIISSSPDNQYPYLSVLVNGKSASIFYAPFDGAVSAGFQAYGEDEEGFELDPDDITNRRNRNEQRICMFKRKSNASAPCVYES